MKLSKEQRMLAYRVIIGEALTAERQKRRMSQQAVSDLTNLSRVSVSYYENAQRSINTDELFALCDACGFDAFAILGKATTATEDELNKAYKKYLETAKTKGSK